MKKPYFNIQKIHRFIVTVRRRLRLEIHQAGASYTGGILSA